jgi:hypothetical protein
MRSRRFERQARPPVTIVREDFSLRRTVRALRTVKAVSTTAKGFPEDACPIIPQQQC